MLNNYKCIVDSHCEVYDLLKPWADDIFWNFSTQEIVQNSIYMIGREQFRLNLDKIKEIARTDQAKIILSNPAEGSETILYQILGYHIEDLVTEKKILIIGGGDIDKIYPCLKYEKFIVETLRLPNNTAAAENNQEIYSKTKKPFKFLFLNGRNRPHRKELLSKLKTKNLLDHALWTCLDSSMDQVKLLPKDYEVPLFQNNIISFEKKFIKESLFNGVYGDPHLYLPQYVDTYFSLVSETVFKYPYSFRTEKIWKPIVIGHPWVAVANYGYYRDLRNLGFKTFHNLINERFDTIDNDLDRLNFISDVVNDLCNSDLDKFMEETKSICKFNQLHARELYKQEIESFPNRFKNFIKDNWPNE